VGVGLWTVLETVLAYAAFECSVGLCSTSGLLRILRKGKMLATQKESWCDVNLVLHSTVDDVTLSNGRHAEPGTTPMSAWPASSAAAPKINPFPSPPNVPRTWRPAPRGGLNSTKAALPGVQSYPERVPDVKMAAHMKSSSRSSPPTASLPPCANHGTSPPPPPFARGSPPVRTGIDPWSIDP